MTEIKEAPKTKTGNGQGQTKETARQTPAEIAEARGQVVRLHAPIRGRDGSGIRGFRPRTRLAAAETARSRPKAPPPRAPRSSECTWSPRIDVARTRRQVRRPCRSAGHEQRRRQGRALRRHAHHRGRAQAGEETRSVKDTATPSAATARSIAASRCRKGSTPSKATADFSQGRARGDDARLFCCQTEVTANRSQRRQVTL